MFPSPQTEISNIYGLKGIEKWRQNISYICQGESVRSVCQHVIVCRVVCRAQWDLSLALSGIIHVSWEPPLPSHISRTQKLPAKNGVTSSPHCKMNMSGGEREPHKAGSDFLSICSEQLVGARDVLSRVCLPLLGGGLSVLSDTGALSSPC